MTQMVEISLVTARLELRPLRPADLSWLSALFSDRRVTEYLATGPMHGAPARDFAGEFIANSVSEFKDFGCGAMAVLRQQAGKAIGYGGLRALPDRFNVAELIYALETGFWGRGYGQEVAGALLDWGFRRYPEMAEIVAMARLENTASITVMKKVGMRHSGRNERYYGEVLELYSKRREDGCDQSSRATKSRA